MIFGKLFAILSFSSALATQLKTINVGSIVNKINSISNNSWKASAYGYSEISIEELRSRLGAKVRKHAATNLIKKLRRVKHHTDKLGDSDWLPTSYDARKEYPNCKSISHIRDQSGCGSSWAVSAASVLSDRLCIHTAGDYDMELSSRFLLSCDKDNHGCEGGYINWAWEFLAKNGTVTGGEYQSDEGCQPYPLHPCGYPRKIPCGLHLFLTPKCLKHNCDNEDFNEKLQKNVTENVIVKVKPQESYYIGTYFGRRLNEYAIKKEIYENGPVQAGFYVHKDFYFYKSGIYANNEWAGVGDHAAKIIGWGEENGVKYWLMANSWGEDWGEDGFFRILRGEDECGIESEVHAGIPAI